MFGVRNFEEFKEKYIYKHTEYFDYQMLFLVLFLCGFGIVMVFSAGSFDARVNQGDILYYLKKEMKLMFVGILFMAILTKINYHLYSYLTIVFMVFMTAIQAYVSFSGVVANGASRWVTVRGSSFQPSEFAKIALVMYMAQTCVARYKKLENIKDLLKILIFPAALVGLIAIENLSTGIICGAICGFIWLIATPNFKNLPILILIVVLAVGILIPLKGGYRLKRITNWAGKTSSSASTGEDTATEDENRQTNQSIYAIGNGGLFGKGLGQGEQKMGNVAQIQNDMIFAAICEELGFVGGIAVIIIYIMLIRRMLFIIDGAPDQFGKLLVFGIMIHIALQAMINIAVSTGSIPNTGVTLPLISAGGSSLIATLGEMGIVLSVSRQIQPKSAKVRKVQMKNKNGRKVKAVKGEETR